MLKPKHALGYKNGRVVILKYLGFETRHLKRAQHWYKIQCECGAVEEASQDQLRSHKQCKACARVSKFKFHQQETPPPADFARLKW